MTEDLLVKHEKLIGRLSCFDIDLSVKSLRIWSYCGPHFPAFGTEYGEILRISPHSV